MKDNWLLGVEVGVSERGNKEWAGDAPIRVV
jgi:hypothetical protein